MRLFLWFFLSVILLPFSLRAGDLAFDNDIVQKRRGWTSWLAGIAKEYPGKLAQYIFSSESKPEPPKPQKEKPSPKPKEKEHSLPKPEKQDKPAPPSDSEKDEKPKPTHKPEPELPNQPEPQKEKPSSKPKEKSKQKPKPKRTPKNIFRVPKWLRKAKQFEYRYIRLRHKEGESCAWYSVLNARAVQDLVAAKKPITNFNIQMRMHENVLPSLTRNQAALKERLGISELFCGLTSVQADQLSCLAGVSNFYCLTIAHNVEKPTYHSEQPDKTMKSVRGDDTSGCEGSDCYHYYLQNLYLVLKRILQSRSPVKHISLSDPFTFYTNSIHGVLVSIITRPGQKPLLIFVDSCTACFESCHATYQLAKYVNQFIKIVERVMQELAEGE